MYLYGSPSSLEFEQKSNWLLKFNCIQLKQYK